MASVHQAGGGEEVARQGDEGVGDEGEEDRRGVSLDERGGQASGDLCSSDGRGNDDQVKRGGGGDDTREKGSDDGAGRNSPRSGVVFEYKTNPNCFVLEKSIASLT